MANPNETTQNVLNTINGITSAVEFNIDKVNSNGITLSGGINVSNIVNFIVDFLEQTKGKDFLIEEISKFIADYLPHIEYTLKGILLGYLQTLMSCSVKPIITEEMLLKGVYFDLQTIDLLNLLQYQPSINKGTKLNNSEFIPEEINSFIGDDDNNPGKYLYFDCDHIQMIPDLIKSKDFNAFLWYVKNAPGTRNVWYGEQYGWDENGIYNPPIPMIREIGTNLVIYKVEQLIEFPKNSGTYFPVTRICKKEQDENGNDIFYTLLGDLVTPGENGFSNVVEDTKIAYAKQAKRNGIVTLEYNAKSSGLSDAEHNALTVPEPIQNCLHVFIGCCDEISPDKEDIKLDIYGINTKIKELNEFRDKIGEFIDKINILIKEYEKDLNDENIRLIEQCQKTRERLIKLHRDLIIEENYTVLETVNVYFPGVVNSIYIDVLEGTGDRIIPIPSSIQDIILKELEDELRNKNKDLIEKGTGKYPDVKSNYYYLHPLIEFNFDLIFSMKWYDEKVVAAQLINAILGIFDNKIDLFTLSLNADLIKQELNKLVEKVIENDDEIINDCFFAFSNDTYNSMLQTSELRRMGIYTNDGENGFIPPSPSEIFTSLNALSPNATKEELITAIEHTLFKAVACANPLISSEDIKLNGDFNLNLNIFEVLIKKLIQVIVSTFLTPKIYMILMFNLKLFENSEGTFDIMQFINYCKSMFLDMIKSIKDLIIKYFTDLIMKILDNILSLFKPLILQEQFGYYQQLLLNCQECFNFNKYDWNMDDVRYADITEQIISTNDEC